MFRKLIILFLVVFFMGLIIFTATMFLTNEEAIYEDNGVNLTVEKPTFITLSEAESQEDGPDITHTRHMTFLGLDVGEFTLVERTLENGTTIIFEEVTNTGWMPFVVSLIQKDLDGADLKSWNPEPAAPVDEEVYGSDPTSNPFGTFSWNGQEMLQGNIYVAREITLGNGEEVYELRHEDPNLIFEEGVLTKSFWLPPKHITHTWMMIADEPLFDSEETEDEWIEFTLNNRTEQLNWLTPVGPLVKLPLTDDPRTQLAYGYIEERTADPTSAEWNETSPSLFFESMMLNAEINRTQQ